MWYVVERSFAGKCCAPTYFSFCKRPAPFSCQTQFTFDSYSSDLSWNHFSRKGGKTILTMWKVSLILVLLIALPAIIAVPISSLLDVKGILPGTECNDVDEIVSSDPCQPFCTCHDGKVFCAELYCSRDNLPTGQNCRKVPTNGKCCPSYLCMTDAGVGELHYPLPQLFLPPELGLTGPIDSKPEVSRPKEDNRKSKLKSHRI